MNPRAVFVRKCVYLGVMIALLVPLYLLSHPPTPGRQGGKPSPGGLLAQLREEHGLSQTHLGQLDPTSETLKLATLGLRGVASTLLWEQANEYKKTKDWTKLAAVLNQLVKFQPNFVAVWRFQGWNLAYNVSVEFDDYRERYHWVIRGIQYLQEGIKYNERDGILIWDVAWMISQKIGKSDETKQFRRLFKQDDDFHGDRPMAQRDNWLVGREWYLRVLELVDKGGRMRGTPVLYRSDPAKNQMSYAEAIEKEGVFGEKARRAWEEGANQWHAFGDTDVPSTFGKVIRLNDQEKHEQNAQNLADELESLSPGLREKIRAEKRSALTQEQLDALATASDQRTSKQHELATQAEGMLVVAHDEVARRIKGPQRKHALQLAEQAIDEEDTATIIRRYREIVNFNYWKLRAAVEQEDQTVAAREWVFRGDEARAGADLPAAREAYEKSLAGWRKVLDKHPKLLADDLTIDDLSEIVDRYKWILKQLDAPWPEPFILDDVVKAKAAKK